MKGFFKQYYAPNNASLAIVGDFDKANAKALVEKYFGPLKRGPDVPKITVDDAADYLRASRGRDRSCRAAASLHRVDHAGVLQARRRRRRRRRERARRRQFEPALQDARLREADRAGRLGVSVFARARIDVPDRRDRPARITRRRRSRRRSTRSSTGSGGAALRKKRSRAAATRSRPPSCRASKCSAGSAAWPTRSTCSITTSAIRATSRNTSMSTARVTPASVKGFVEKYLTPQTRVVVHGVPGPRKLAPPVATPAPPKVAAGTGAEAINAEAAWRASAAEAGRPIAPSSCRRRGRSSWPTA